MSPAVLALAALDDLAGAGHIAPLQRGVHQMTEASQASNQQPYEPTLQVLRVLLLRCSHNSSRLRLCKDGCTKLICQVDRWGSGRLHFEESLSESLSNSSFNIWITSRCP